LEKNGQDNGKDRSHVLEIENNYVLHDKADKVYNVLIIKLSRLSCVLIQYNDLLRD